MLTLLKIRNLALVDRLEWDLGGGLVGVTGETGAGKSVIVGALKLVLGERADKGLIRTGEEECVVEAVFELADSRLVDGILEEVGLDGCEGNELIIRRVVGRSRSRQFVNNGAATLGVLKRIGGYLVDLHGPHDHQSLLSVERQLGLLDAYAGSLKEVAQYGLKWGEWRSAMDEYEVARAQREMGEQEKELLRFQVEEIDDAELRVGEEEELEERFQRTSHASRLAELTARASEVLGESVVPGLEDLQRVLGEVRGIDGGVTDLVEEVEGMVVQVRELEQSVGTYSGELVVDPGEVAVVEERFNLVESLKRKYGASVEEILDHAEEVRGKLEGSENREEYLSGLKARVDEALKGVRSVGRKVTAKRKKAAPRLAEEVRGHLVDLGFRQGEFEVNLEGREEPGSSGMEGVEFLFGPNPGEPLKPLRQVASSGEISRVMLAVKNALAMQDATPLMVFDEIDANVGGEIARAVGEKMASLGERHQVVAITHFPQVAAVAHQHFLVEKRVEGGRSLSSLVEVRGESRLDELVRMLGGGEGEEVREMAKSLLK